MATEDDFQENIEVPPVWTLGVKAIRMTASVKKNYLNS